MPPEVIAGQLMTGDGGASIAAATAAYESLVAMLTAEAATMGANTAGTAAGGWEGLGGTAMVATAMPYLAALEGLIAWVQQAGASAAEILQAFLTARQTVIPVPACEANRTAQAEAVATNFCGFRTPEIIGYDTEYFGHFWTQNASIAGSYEGIVTALLAALATPGPPAPLTANPAGPAAQAAAIGEAVGNGAAKAGMNSSLQGVNEAASGAHAPAEAAQLASSAPQMLSQLGQLPQMMGQLPQMLGQFPQMMSQFPQMAMGMLGPLASGMNANSAGLNALNTASAELAPVATNAGLTGSSTASSGLSGSSAVMSSFTRPTSSFNAPGPPKLPTGWAATQAAAGPQVAGSAQPAMTGGTGGLYGAPPLMRDDRGNENAKPVRTMQLTTAPAPGRGD